MANMQRRLKTVYYKEEDGHQVIDFDVKPVSTWKPQHHSKYGETVLSDIPYKDRIMKLATVKVPEDDKFDVEKFMSKVNASKKKNNK